MDAVLDAVTHDEARDVYVVDVPRAWSIIRGAAVEAQVRLIRQTAQHPPEICAGLLRGDIEPHRADDSSGALTAMVTQAVHDALGGSIAVQLVGGKFP